MPHDFNVVFASRCAFAAAGVALFLAWTGWPALELQRSAMVWYLRRMGWPAAADDSGDTIGVQWGDGAAEIEGKAHNPYEYCVNNAPFGFDSVGLTGAGAPATAISCGAALARQAALVAALIAAIAFAEHPTSAIQAAQAALKELRDLIAVLCAAQVAQAVELRRQLRNPIDRRRPRVSPGPDSGPKDEPSGKPPGRPPTHGPDQDPGPRGGKCESYLAWCLEVQNNPECGYNPGAFGGDCQRCYTKCKQSPFERWPMEDCPMGRRTGPRWPGPGERHDPVWPD